ncbi:MAG: ABC-2 type transport system ATP-binding protein [Alphaproteobacteria bacterium]|jgi:ABC-2 type transport system ATP-binding protein
MININNITKYFGDFLAVDHISFNAVRGQILGFLGPNGAGKTTTMRIITGALQPDSGSVFLCDVDIAKNPVLAKQFFGYLPEGAPLYEDMTPREYLNFIADIKQITPSTLQSTLQSTVNNTMIDHVLDESITYLSKGYKRRVALAGALLGDPQILVLDEPTDGLDPNQKRHIRKLLKKLSRNKTIIISTHILEEVEAICNHTITINQGRVVASATPKELMAMSNSYNAVILIIQTQSCDDCILHIKKLPTIDHIVIMKKMPHWTKIMIYPKSKKYILGEIADIVHTKEYHIAEIRCDTGRIDDVFKQLTHKHTSPY